ncbi:PadR family transcriptional regulator [Streptomyces katrae]|uniref:PadR family transcriptional regulator n=1 Tax=Streptomyces katrae TaxID=68223 RepID=UPI0004C00E22|nr:PadR family transcriptional regulator [Streptomyces katrae]
MPPVFAHGRLRLYLLKLLDEAPRHGYEVIRLLEERFQGLYAPSAGTVYPRLAKLEAEGLVTHATEGGRKVYSITEAGRAELADRGGELADLELEIRDSVSELAAEIRDDVRGAAGALRREMRAAASATATPVEDASWAAAKEELRKARQEWKEQARRAKDESRRAREEAQQARRQAKEAQERAREEVMRIAGQLQEQFAKSGGVLGNLAGSWLGGAGSTSSTSGAGAGAGAGAGTGAGTGTAGAAAADLHWAEDLAPTGDPSRDLDRLLDRFRDHVRDAARDHGVTAAKLAEARAHLATAADRLAETLRPSR